jgi:Spy/CpxP family protein refolding chaperone
MRRFSALFALTALAAASVGLAQQTAPQTEPPPANNPSTTQPSDPGASSDSESSQANKQALMKDCMQQVRAANPGVPDKDIKNFCDKQINQPPPPHD